MKYLANYRNVKVHCEGNPHDIPELIHKAWEHLQVVKGSQTGEIKEAVVQGKWKVRSYHGKEEIFILAPKPIPAVAEKELIQPVYREEYVPAFHTYALSGIWLGITICISGKWGPPYIFLPIPYEKIWSFDYGFWNINKWATPPPAEYKNRLLGIFTQGKFELIGTEIKAEHQYICDTFWCSSDDVIATAFTSSSIIEEHHCDVSDALIGEVINAYYNVTTNSNNPIVLYTDFNAACTALPNVSDEKIIVSTKGPYVCGTNWASSILVPAWSGSGPTACEQAYANLTPTVDWNAMLSSYQDAADLYTWNVVVTQTGRETFNAWGTFDGITPEKGCFVFSALVHDKIMTHVRTSLWGPLLTGVNDNGIWVTLQNPYDSSDFINAFNKEYLLKSFPSSVIAWANRILYCNPRVYMTQRDKGKIALASIYRASGQWEYTLFKPGVTQYNDLDATYAGTSARHTLPITFKEEQCYGNGDFSLLRISYADESNVKY